MHTAPLNKHGLPIFSRRQHHPRPIVIATPPRVTCSTPSCRGLAIHTLERHDLCDACYEQGFEDIIWHTN